MPKRNILILDTQGSPWSDFLKEFFEDTASELHFFYESSQANLGLGRIRHDILFLNPQLLSLPLAQKINAMKHSSAEFRVFQIGKKENEAVRRDLIDHAFDKPPSFVDFQKDLSEHLPFNGTIRLLVVDDEPEVGNMIKDFLKGRVQPAFVVECASDGNQGLEAIEKQKPDAVILDIKMPVMDGREMYREIKERKIEVPVIIFFDVISHDEVAGIHEIGNPAIVEKGSRQSEMPILLDLIKKMAFFG